MQEKILQKELVRVFILVILLGGLLASLFLFTRSNQLLDTWSHQFYTLFIRNG